MAAAGLAARAAPGQIARRQHGQSRPGIDVRVGTGIERIQVGPDDLWVGGIVRRQPVTMWLRQGAVGEWVGRWGRPVGCPHLVTRLAHRTWPHDRTRRRRPARGEGTGHARYLFAALLAGARLAGAFLAGALLAGALRAGAFLAAERAGAFLAAAGAADLPAAATAASLVG